MISELRAHTFRGITWAGFLEMLLPLGLAYTLTSRLKPVAKVFLGYASLAVLAGIAVTISRGAYCSTALALLLFFGVLLFHRTYRLPSLVLLAVVLGAGAYYLPKSYSVQARLKLRSEGGGIDTDTRVLLWRSAGDHRRGPVSAAEPAADLVILDDADLGFRGQPELWPAVLGLADDAACRRPRARSPAPGSFSRWPARSPRASCGGGSFALHAGRLVVVMTLNDLRLSEVKISRELSWERIAGDLAREAGAPSRRQRAGLLRPRRGLAGHRRRRAAVPARRRSQGISIAWTSPTATSSSTPRRSRTAGPSSTRAR